MDEQRRSIMNRGFEYNVPTNAITNDEKNAYFFTTKVNDISNLNDIKEKYINRLNTTTGDINITVEELNDIISSLKSGIQGIRNSWEVEIAKAISQLSSSWVGQECETYIAKVKAMDTKLKKALEALSLLLNTFTSVRDKTEGIRKNIIDSINNI